MRKFSAIFLSILLAAVSFSAKAEKLPGDTATVNRAFDLANAGEYQKALQMLLEAERTFTPDTTSFYGSVEFNIGLLYHVLDDKQNAAAYWEKALTAFPKFSDNYGMVLDELGKLYIDLNDEENTYRLMQLTQEYNEEQLLKHCVTFKDFIERFDYFAAIMDTEKARENILEALKSASNPEEQETAYEKYASFLKSMEDFSTAAANYKLALDIHLKRLGKDEKWCIMTYYLGNCYFSDENYDDAYTTFESASEGFAAVGKTNFALSCKSMTGDCKYFSEDYAGALKIYEEVLAATDKNDTENYAQVLIDLAKANKRLENYDDAIKYCTEAVELTKNAEEHDLFQVAIAELRMIYASSGKKCPEEYDIVESGITHKVLKDLLATEKRNLENFKLMFGEDGLEYANSLATIADITYQIESKEAGLDYYRQYLDTQKKALRRNFATMNANERKAVWEKTKAVRDSITSHLVDTEILQDINLLSKASALVYDLQLLSKGILLNSSIELGKVIESGGDNSLKEAYAQALELEKRIKAAQAANNAAESSSLRQEYDNVLLNLMKKCNELDDFTKYIDYSWADVLNTLNDNEIAIEFVELKNDIWKENNLIAALLITKGVTNPISLPICLRSNAMEIVSDPLAYQKPEYGEIVWGYILQMLPNVKTIYFSADAEFSNIGIEYFIVQGKPLIDRCNVYRLSSTKELCRNHPAVSFNNVALFGNMNYGETGKEKKVKWSTSRSGNNEDFTSGIISFAPLKETQNEIDGIKSALKNKGNVKPFSKAEASETSFRNLSGKGINIIHIATHGQYIGNKDTTEDDAMQCSILALSGANIPSENEAEDGIITAGDIAEMDFRQCSLAVLSACETGLGHLSTDGVFGLQRGFKNAGVHTLLMSLSKVDDSATKALMVKFYETLASQPGISPNEALRIAQKYVRDNSENNFRDPKYWAPFIILDGK